MKVPSIDNETIMEFDRIKRSRHRSTLLELYVYSYLKRKYDVIIEHGYLDFVAIDFSTHKVDVYEVKGESGALSKYQLDFIRSFLKLENVRVFIVTPRNLFQEVKQIINTPFGNLYVFEITNENFKELLKKVPLKKEHYEF